MKTQILFFHTPFLKEVYIWDLTKRTETHINIGAAKGDSKIIGSDFQGLVAPEIQEMIMFTDLNLKFV